MRHVQKIVYETAPCSRCDGSGRHSYCPGYGDRCFKCGGNGTQLSRRGTAALAKRNAWVAENVDMTAATVQVGDKIDMVDIVGNGMGGIAVTSRWVRVSEVKRELDASGRGVQVVLSLADGRTYVPDGTVRRKLRGPELDALGARMEKLVGCTVHYYENEETD